MLETVSGLIMSDVNTNISYMHITSYRSCHIDKISPVSVELLIQTERLHIAIFSQNKDDKRRLLIICVDVEILLDMFPRVVLESDQDYLIWRIVISNRR